MHTYCRSVRDVIESCVISWSAATSSRPLRGPRSDRLSTTVLTRRVPPVCVQLERKRRAPRRSLPVPHHRCETTRSRQLCFVQGAQRFGGPSARTCTRWMRPQEDVSRGRRETIARCRLFPEPSRGSPQWQVRRGGIHQRPDTLALRARLRAQSESELAPGLEVHPAAGHGRRCRLHLGARPLAEQHPVTPRSRSGWRPRQVKSSEPATSLALHDMTEIGHHAPSRCG